MNPGLDRSDMLWRADRARISRAIGGTILREIRHDADLSLLVERAPIRWSDALLSETRAWIGGSLNAIELAIILAVDKAPFDGLLSEIGTAYCRQAIEHEPQILSPVAIAHFRLRAALALVARSAFSRQVPLEPEQDGGLPILADESALGESFVALTLAESRWLARPLPDAPARADLPAEIYSDLAWAVAALLVQFCERRAAGPSGGAIQAIAAATERVIARHDEGSGIFALAERVARGVPAEERREVAALALAERRLLLFAALTATEAALPLEVLLGALLDHDAVARIAILRAMDVEHALATRTLSLIADAMGEALDDAALIALSDRYLALDGADARRWLAGLQGPGALISRLSTMERPAA